MRISDWSSDVCSSDLFKDRIIAKTVGAARRPDDEAIDTTLECLDMPIGPGEGEGADEMGIMSRFGAFGSQIVPDKLHREAKVAVRTGPTRREDTRFVSECLAPQAAVVRQRGRAGTIPHLNRLHFCLGAAAGA